MSRTEKIIDYFQERLNYEPKSLEDTLETMYNIIWELKNHEIIENTVIMNRLRERLLARQIDNQSVCNCHEDSDLMQIIDLLESVYSANTDVERNFYWQKLQEALYEFLDDFVPHMEEEENTFQPLLNEHFNYDELRQIKETVISQHQEWKEKLSAEKSLKRFKLESEGLDSRIVAKKRKGESESPSENLPAELLHKIFGYLADPRDFSRAGRVCRRWREVSRSPDFWRNLPLSQWERDIWSWSSVHLDEIIQAERRNPTYGDDNEDNSFNERVVSLLDGIGEFCIVMTEKKSVFLGPSVHQLSVSGSSSLSNSALREMLKVKSCRDLPPHDPSLSLENIKHT